MPEPVLTLFSAPKPFKGIIGTIQTNAILSWQAIRPEPQVILIGNEQGVAGFADKHGIKHIPGVECNSKGVPLIPSIFSIARREGSASILCYVNADIILPSNFIQMISQIKSLKFLIAGRRWDLQVDGAIDFTNRDWEKELLADRERHGVLHGHSAMDYFVFPKSVNVEFPQFPVGRPGWDNWFLYAIGKQNIPIIDGTDALTVIHQNHPPAYSPGGSDAQYNSTLGGGNSDRRTLLSTDWYLSMNGLIRPPFNRRLLGMILSLRSFQLFLGFKREIQLYINKCTQ